MREPRSTGRSLRTRPGRANLARHQDQREMAKPAREVGDVQPPRHVVLLGGSAGDPAEHLGGDGHHSDDLANGVKLEALARHGSRHGPDWTAGMLAKLECVATICPRSLPARRCERALTAPIHGGCRTNRSAKWCVNQSWDHSARIDLELRFFWDEATKTVRIRRLRPTVARANSSGPFAQRPPSTAGTTTAPASTTASPGSSGQTSDVRGYCWSSIWEEGADPSRL